MEDIHVEVDLCASIMEHAKVVEDGENKEHERYKEELKLQGPLNSPKGKINFALRDCGMTEYAAPNKHGSVECEKEGEDIQKEEHKEYYRDQEMEGSPDIEEVADESGGEDTPTSGSDDETNTEVNCLLVIMTF